ncbi:hypothetical protein GCM10025787_12050 [Saccharopolyspora rosea]|uniref:Uncharacterized protein n=1 Tax=Saccharopolyspora rosea TaxID=524884 RepID=A0ABW3FT00_9PSEU
MEAGPNGWIAAAPLDKPNTAALQRDDGGNLPEALMGVPAFLWPAATTAALVLLGWDLLRPRRASVRARAVAVCGFLLPVVVLALAVLAFAGPDAAGRLAGDWAESWTAGLDTACVLVALAGPGASEAAVVVAMAVRLLLAAIGPQVSALAPALSVLLGGAALAAGWAVFGGRTPPWPRAGVAAPVAVAAAVLATQSVSATFPDGRALALCANVLALLGLRDLCLLLCELAAVPPGPAVLLLFVGAKSLLGGVLGTPPQRSPGADALTLAVVVLVAALGAVTAARARQGGPDPVGTDLPAYRRGRR